MGNRTETLLKQAGSMTKPHFKKQKGKRVTTLRKKKNPPKCCSAVLPMHNLSQKNKAGQN